jgi:CRP-like cAMP-binding protein
VSFNEQPGAEAEAEAEGEGEGEGEAIVTQGEEGEAMYIIVEGEARVELDGRLVGGAPTLGPCAFFGELALVGAGELRYAGGGGGEGGGQAAAAAAAGVRTATVRAVGTQPVHCLQLVRAATTPPGGLGLTSFPSEV